jgi:5'-deoxynucleotidase YfbR-like HD superfamily hydrolase
MRNMPPCENEKNTWVVTFTGQKFNPLNPDPLTINIHDIAHGLSNICRFTGQTRNFYSVAQHSYYVSLLCDKYKMWGLLHDASEAYLNDIATPLKNSSVFERYRKAESWLQGMILSRFGIGETEVPREVKGADEFMGVWEGMSFMPEYEGAFWTDRSKLLYDEGNYEPLRPWQPLEAEARFLQRFYSLKAEGWT